MRVSLKPVQFFIRYLANITDKLKQTSRSGNPWFDQSCNKRLSSRRWYSNYNCSDPQSSLVTQQQAAWHAPPGGRFGLGSGGNRRRLARGCRRREEEKDVTVRQVRLHEQSSHRSLFQSHQTAAAASIRSDRERNKRCCRRNSSQQDVLHHKQSKVYLCVRISCF